MPVFSQLKCSYEVATEIRFYERFKKFAIILNILQVFKHLN